jgi:hypothetical protein
MAIILREMTFVPDGIILLHTNPWYFQNYLYICVNNQRYHPQLSMETILATEHLVHVLNLGKANKIRRVARFSQYIPNELLLIVLDHAGMLESGCDYD